MFCSFDAAHFTELSTDINVLNVFFSSTDAIQLNLRLEDEIHSKRCYRHTAKNINFLISDFLFENISFKIIM